MEPVVFSIGSNIGNKIANIKAALDGLSAIDGLTIDTVSCFYKTPPWGVEDQDWFVNICASGHTSLQPNPLLGATQSVEKAIGREKTIRWGPRLIDIDILFYGDKIVDIPDLTIPHKSITERAFVLVPLQEIAGTMTLNGKTMSELIEQLPDEGASITKMTEKRWIPIV
ncbi:MAG: 2-amino-4-hydroxy-6-hydroxymethyldihydropteridine diphosphokinase [Hyphomicrobiales bacterium]